VYHYWHLPRPALRTVRDDEIAASRSGLRVGRLQTLSFVVSAGCAGLGGAMLAVVLQLAVKLRGRRATAGHAARS
jgi:ABC-type branched-subunit amino acid transport system permease subunit